MNLVNENFPGTCLELSEHGCQLREHEIVSICRDLTSFKREIEKQTVT